MTTLFRMLVILLAFTIAALGDAPAWVCFFGSVIVGYLVVPEKPWEDS